MKFLIIGSGAREHAIAWSLAKSPAVGSLLVAPGNPGMSRMAERHSVSVDDHEGILELCRDEAVDVVVIGPEAPLVEGLADTLREAGIRVFGPGSRGARLEGSKAYAKSLMRRAKIPTASAEEFTDPESAMEHIDRVGLPLVVKADGLASGKGVTVCFDRDSAEAALKAALVEGRFGEGGRRVLLEEYMQGEELSVLAFTDGSNVLAMEPAQDFKRAFDADTGPNTGGMGSYSPVPFAGDDVAEAVRERVLEPIVRALSEDAEPYVGVIYAGLMLTAEGPKVVEFNSRFGDPEAQVVLPRLETDLAEVIMACIEGRLDEVKLRWRPESCVCVVAASNGYPGDFQSGFAIEGLQDAEEITGIPVFHAGTKLGPDGTVVTSGGRVLSVCALGADLESARRRAYEGVHAVRYPGMWFRNDIALKASSSI